MIAKGPSLLRHTISRFVIVGLVVLALENAAVWALVQVLDNYVLVRAISTIVAILLSYALHTGYSFSSTHSVRRFVSFVVGVSASVAVSYLVSLACYYLLFSGSRPLLSTNIGAVAAAIANYVFQRHITYAKRES